LAAAIQAFASVAKSSTDIPVSVGDRDRFEVVQRELCDLFEVACQNSPERIDFRELGVLFGQDGYAVSPAAQPWRFCPEFSAGG
jgi:hypothetical protein